MKPILSLLFEGAFYLLGLYLCLVWANWVSRPSWIQEEVEPVYAVLGAIGLIIGFIWRATNKSPNINIHKLFKNIVKNNWITVKGDFQVGDKGGDKNQKQTKKNVIVNSVIKSKNFNVGDTNE